MTIPELCVVFDLDDTLYLERDYVRSGFEHVGIYAEEELGIPNFAKRAWSLFLAGHRGTIFDKILQEQNIQWERSTLEHLVALYRSHSPQIRLLPDALLCLGALQGKVRLAIISDGPIEAQRNKVAALRLDQWFNPVLLTEELGRGYTKPCASAFCSVQEQFGFNAARFYYIADNPVKDFIAARKLGWRTIRVRRREGLYAAVEVEGDWAADVELSDLSGLPNLLQETWLSECLPNESPAVRVPGERDTLEKDSPSTEWHSTNLVARPKPRRTLSKLAIDGGEPIRTNPLNPWPCFDSEDIEAATGVLRSGKVNYWTGEEGRRFEEEFAAQAGCKYGIAVANGTVALELALHTFGVGPGDEVIVPSRTFIASASCAVMRGATPVMADVDADSQNITVETIRPLLSPRTKAIVAVHLAGWPCDMDPIAELAREHGLKVIEDCAQCHGATYKGRPVGSLGDAGAFSFCQDKIMTTGGEGGMVTTNEKAVWEQAWSYKDHGKSYEAVYNREHPPGFHWLHESFGTNWRLTEFQSALGRVLLGKLHRMVEVRRRNAAILTQGFTQHDALRVPQPPSDIGHSYYKYYAFVRPGKLRKGWTRDRILSAIVAEGIPCFTGSCSEIYLEKAFASELRPTQRLMVAKELGETSLMFLVHPTLSEIDMHDTCWAVAKVLDAARSSEHRRQAHRGVSRLTQNARTAGG
jgi:dTDP-4-amino-4,6-dideoxygalactose transaminase/FMN phosphatase YigB (HAD superfamily)